MLKKIFVEYFITHAIVLYKNIFKKNITIPLLTPTILGTYFHFHSNKPFFKDVLNLKTEEQYDQYILNDLTKHIQQTIKSLLVYEN